MLGKNNSPDLFSIVAVRKRAMVGIGTTDFQAFGCPNIVIEKTTANSSQVSL